MAKFDPKAEVSPAVAAIVIIIVVAIAAGLVIYFMNREAPQEMPGIGPDEMMPGPVPGAPQMPGAPGTQPGPPMPPPPPPSQPPGG